MQLKISRIPPEETEVLDIRCHRISDDVQEIISFVKSRQGQLTAVKDGQSSEIPLIDIFYAESVDNRVFVYTAKESYEVRLKLYELEDMMKGRSFLRVQKSMLLNLMKVRSIRPALGGRYGALLKNGEEVLISRKYVADLKATLDRNRAGKGGEVS